MAGLGIEIRLGHKKIINVPSLDGKKNSLNFQLEYLVNQANQKSSQKILVMDKPYNKKYRYLTTFDKLKKK